MTNIIPGQSHQLRSAVSSKSNNIPIVTHLFEEILLTLDPETISHCAFVCRDWNSLITSPHFMCLYSHRNFNSRNQVFLAKPFHGYSLHWDNDDFDLLRAVDSPPIDGFQGYTVVGTSNGLVCFADNISPNKLTLWNPTIRKYVHIFLPRSSVTPTEEYRSCLGFGFDGRSKDFKIVNLVHHKDKLHTVWLFSYATWSWKRLTTPPPPCYVIDEVSHVLINGILHWLAWDLEGHYQFILKFNLAHEVFGEILFPHSVPVSSAKKLLIAGDLLVVSLFSIDSSSPPYFHIWSVWVMKQYGVDNSWTRIIALKERGIIFLRRLIFLKNVLAMRKNGDIIIELKSGQILIYNPTTSATNVPVYPTLRQNSAFIGYHDESLHLLEKVSTLGESIKSY